MKPSRPAVRVLGIGNVLMGDDAIGPYAVRLLEARYRLPEGVSAEDLGTPGLDLTDFVEGLDALIVVDAVSARGRPGEIRRYYRQALLGTTPAPVPVLSPHEPGLREALLTSELHDAAPRDVVLVGVIPEKVDGSVGLSVTARCALPAAVDAVVSELARLGVRPEPRDPPLAPDIWWER